MVATTSISRAGPRLLWAALAAMLMSSASAAQDTGDLSLELIDPEALRVCADPGNLPFSNEKQEGFENEIAGLLAKKLGKGLDYTWFPQATGFVRNTLGAHRCDVIIGYAQGDELVQNTNPYYRTAYALVFAAEAGLDGIETLSDPRLQGKRIGIIAGTPPSNHLVANGLMARAKPYPLMIDTRVDSSAKSMIDDLVAADIDVGILWGPLAGYYAQRAAMPLRVVPLLKETQGPRLAYNITMGVRVSDQEWKRTLNRMIRDEQQAINEILQSYDVPLLDQRNEALAKNQGGRDK